MYDLKVNILYIDESYDENWYWFGAVLVHEEKDAHFQRTLLSIPGRYTTDYGISEDTELHGYTLWHLEDEWKPLKANPRLCEHTFKLALRAIVEADASVYFIGVDRCEKSLDKANHARAKAVDFLLSYVELESTKLDERCLLIFDEETSTINELKAAIHKHHRFELESGKAPRIVEGPVIRTSHHSPGVQAADLSIFLHRRNRDGKENNSEAQSMRDRLLKIIEPVTCVQIKP
jgi:hypothetical protein